MDQEAFVEERGDTTIGAVDPLIDEDKIARRNFLAKRSHGAAGHEVRHSERLQREDVGAIGAPRRTRLERTLRRDPYRDETKDATEREAEARSSGDGASEVRLP